MKDHLVIADAHVHFYDCFDMEQLFDSAFNNFHKNVGNLVKGAPFSAFLFLAETKSENWFHQFSTRAEKGPARAEKMGKWELQPTQEDCSLYVHPNGNKKDGLYLIAGRQIKARENLEVLALGTIQDLEERAPLEELIRQIGQLGAIPVIPWGAGKWIGRRGEFLKNLLGRDLPPSFLGDNRNRPIFWPKPYLFKQAGEKGLSILPGTDPLPFPSEMWQIGNFGFKVHGSINSEYPFRDIKKLLLDPVARPRAYGSLENPVRFFCNQLRMKWMKRK
ncbi:MAG: hypothetical protein WA974_17970 [Thermodesulfobacteriota bacterium]